MSYIENNLNHGEHIVYKCKISLMVYFKPLIYVLFAAIIYFVGRHSLHLSNIVVMALSLMVLFVALYQFSIAFNYREFTEIGVTNQRIIYKTGAVSRESVEFPLEKIESVIVEQTVWQRIIDAGTVEPRGTGSGLAPIRMVDDPVVFRNAINEAIAEAKNSGNSQ